MTIKHVRLTSILILIIVVVSKQLQILYYFPIMIISLEFLNHNKQYLHSFNFKILNAVFISYVLFICIDRGRPSQFNVATELVINSLEHLLFGFIICVKASIYYSLFKKENKLKQQTLILIALGFNIFGFANEFFQNWYKQQSLWQVNFDSAKDILMNIIGSIIFIILYSKIDKRIHNQHHTNLTN